ncbi:condensation domain-containing protein, partial [Trinickia mobilis]|uniref:condensation domain-containing protein n=1 Tax=Trinickia mobilis TaxID=2816356 RepID=UPI001F5CA5A2
GREYEAPQGETETLIAQIWEQVLGVKRVGREDSFFELGGHSLLATRVISQLRKQLGVELPLRALFEAPVLDGFSEYVMRQQRMGAGLERPELEVQSRPERLPLSYAQERIWVHEQMGLPGAAYTIPGAVGLEGELDVVALEGALAAIVARHESLRTRFASVDGVPYQVIDETLGAVLEHEELSGLEAAQREAQVLRAAREEAQRGFDLERGPLLRVKLLRLGEREHVVLLSMHHIVSDGWSMGVLIEELGRQYAAQVSGTPAQLAPLAVQYADYALWQRAWLQGEALERQKSYWRGQLAEAPGVLELPLDHVRPAQQSFRGAHLPVR